MNEQFLSLAQNTCAARIFLNIFGLVLENKEDINEFSNIKIFDKFLNEVGLLYFSNGKVIMQANYNDSILNASFDIAKSSSFVDSECKSVEVALFVRWCSKVKFLVQIQSNKKLSGEILIGSSIDTEFGIKCLCHPMINCDIDGVGSITLEILRDGKTFGLKIVSGKYNETIDIRPWDDLNGFIEHIIVNGEYNPQSYQHEYKKYAGVFSAGINDTDRLHVFLSKTKWDKQLSFRNEFPLKEGEDNSEKLVIQKGKLMQDLDPDMFDRIKKLRDVLKFGDVSLLDNLVSVCFDSFTDEEICALVGIQRQTMIYQDGSNNLINSYFGVEQQKALLKKMDKGNLK